METNQQNTPNKTFFQSYFPLSINGYIFLDPNLNDNEKTIIALAQLLRLQVAYAKNEVEQKNILKKFTSSYFASATGKHRDHIRRLINKMQSSEHVQKYLTIFILPKVELNQENVFRFTFKDNLPDTLNMTRQKDFENENEDKLEWHTETLIQNYLNGIKELKGETPRSLTSLLRCDSNELIKGLIYLKEMLRKKEIKNPKGYLISSFDINGIFKYQIKPAQYLPTNSDLKVSDDFEFEVDKNQFLLYEKQMKENSETRKFNFYYRENGSKLFLSKITEAGKPRNIKNHLQRAGIEYKIVAKYEV